jgi:hypothetical protein
MTREGRRTGSDFPKLQYEQAAQPPVCCTLALDAALQAVAEVEVQRRWRNQQPSPPEAGVAQVGGKGEQPDTDAKAHADHGATVPVVV